MDPFWYLNGRSWLAALALTWEVLSLSRRSGLILNLTDSAEPQMKGRAWGKYYTVWIFHKIGSSPWQHPGGNTITSQGFMWISRGSFLWVASSSELLPPLSSHFVWLFFLLTHMPRMWGSGSLRIPQTPGAGGPADVAASAALPAPQPAFPGPGTALCFGELLQVDAVGLFKCLASQAKQKLASWALNLECALRVAA